ncbi:NAD-dependent epimerase/dehydratase family protein [Hydrogenovibrio sp. JE_KL2]|uniref:NAD-dependent epimerase/dehydratase family protein n=1 Tax=Hydrogenovibrio sp. JE_KL2 TaxID=2651188 RepID=UPI00128BE65D|nr:NAD-dependent epimerase/dehydratase family protein [Hydrogenovibrio sp. JE_KL2]MPQ75471.1 NAD-dependent epimerase/dehydratase family protein [Hydrogenovibrio sp. JE_KL2]
MKVFLTGATGFVGSALLNRFVVDGVEITALVRRESLFPAGVKQLVGDISIVMGKENLSFSLSNRDEFESILRGMDSVVHVAARIQGLNDKSLNSMAEYRKINRDATLALASLASDAGVKRFVFLSTIKVNGESSGDCPFEPETHFIPDDPYALSKYEAEQGLMQIAEKTGMEVVIIRPPLVYGPGVKGNFASMVAWVKKGIPLPLAAVNNRRSLIALDNLVDFIALCSERKHSPMAANEVFLISDDEDVSTAELLSKIAFAYKRKSRLFSIPVWLMKLVAKLLGKESKAERVLGNLQVNSSKVQAKLGWKPIVTMDEQLMKMASLEKVE